MKRKLYIELGFIVDESNKKATDNANLVYKHIVLNDHVPPGVNHH